jgi:hypothetical protein
MTGAFSAAGQAFGLERGKFGRRRQQKFKERGRF